MRRFLLLSGIFAVNCAIADDTRHRSPSPTSVIEDSMCIPELNGEGYLHVDEDVSGLIIEVVGSDGTSVARYDAGTEIEDISVLGTYAAPSANNVRVSPDGLGGDCTQMMFADAVYAGQEWVTIRVTDGQTTIMDFARFVYLDGITSRMTGLPNLTTFASVSDDLNVVLTAGAGNDGAYPPGSLVRILDDDTSDECSATVNAYTGATKAMEFRPYASGQTAACEDMSLDADDIIYIYDADSPGDAEYAQVLLDEFDGNAGVKLEANAVKDSTIEDNAIGDDVWSTTQASQAAPGTFGEIASEIADTLVDTAEIGVAGAGLTEAGGTGDQYTAVPYNSAWDAEIQSEAADALTAYDPPTRAELTSDINSIAALLGIAEPAGVPDFGDDAGDVLSWLLTLSRNEINQTATTKTIRNDADDGDIATCAVSDDGTTFTRAECQ